MERAYEWYTSGPRQRLQPGGKIILVMTRWSTKDLTGALVASQKEVKADKWHVVEFPAIMDNGPVWPDFVEGSHHRHIADKFNKLATGEINRLIINMPPRHTKSEFAS